MEQDLIWLIVGFALLADLLLIMLWRRNIAKKNVKNGDSNTVKILGTTSPVLTWVRKALQRLKMYGESPKLLVSNSLAGVKKIINNILAFSKTLDSKIDALFSLLREKWETNQTAWKPKLATILEIALIAFFTIYIGKNYLNMNAIMVPHGGDFPHEVYNHIIWTWWGDCGSCIFWNGTMDGGDPAFANLQGSALHPVTILTTLVAGVINGSKLIMLVALFMGGIAQWWLAKEFGLGRIASLWCAFAAILGPQYNLRMENGLVNIALSTSSAVLTLPLIIRLLKKGPSPQRVAFLGIFLSLFILSGQGYIQVGYIVGFCPILLLSLIKSISPFRFKSIAKSFAQAAVIAILISSVFLVPLFHFFPYVEKDGNSGMDFGNTISEMVHGLVEVQDEDIQLRFFYLGWGVVILGITGLILSKPEDRTLLFLMACTSIWILIFASENFMKFIFNYIPIVEKLRTYVLITGLAVPFFLILSGYGINRLIQFVMEIQKTLSAEWMPLTAVITIGILGLALFSLIKLNQINNHWFYVQEIADSYDLQIAKSELQTNPQQWVETYYNSFSVQLYLQNLGYKLTNAYRPFHLKDRSNPQPYTRISFDPIDPQTTKGEIKVIDQYHTVITNPENQYAYVTAQNGRLQPCKSSGKGGKISVTCDYSKDGTLIVMENFVPGWKVYIDGKSAALLEGAYLSVPAQAGLHTYEFVYDPWDVKVGIFLSIIGLIITARLIFKQEPASQLG
jgi:hypothetical protein